MSKANSLERHLVLFVPWALSALLNSDAVVSYLIAWLGSFFIFYISLTGWVKPIPTDRSIAEQLMRPIFIIQIIFAGYMCCTSIFYFLNILGYNYLQKINNVLAINQTALEL